MCENLHTYKYLHRRCCDREVIVKAWMKLRKGKTQRKEVIKIEADFEYYVDKMQRMIMETRPGGDPELQFWPEKTQTSDRVRAWQGAGDLLPDDLGAVGSPYCDPGAQPDSHAIRVSIQLWINARTRRSIWEAVPREARVPRL